MLRNISSDFRKGGSIWSELSTYRARVKFEGRFPVNNRIIYFYPKKLERNSQHKLEMFKANGVETASEKLYGDKKVNYYNRILDKIENGI